MSEETIPEFPKKGSNGTATQTSWSVEARHCFSDPVQIGKQLFDERWRTVQFNDADFGVPVRERDRAQGYFNYAAAQALRWWFHATAEITGGGICLETRLVKHITKSHFECEAVSAHCLITGEDRSNIMPDWGTQS